MHRLGLAITPRHHRVEQLPPRYSPGFIQIIGKGPDAVPEFVRERVWGMGASSAGERRLRSSCDFVKLHHQGVGVVEIAGVPNTPYFTDLLQKLGMKSVHVSYEKGQPTNTVLNRREASTLPIFNEFIKTYRFQRMIHWPKNKD